MKIQRIYYYLLFAYLQVLSSSWVLNNKSERIEKILTWININGDQQQQQDRQFAHFDECVE